MLVSCKITSFLSKSFWSIIIRFVQFENTLNPLAIINNLLELPARFAENTNITSNQQSSKPLNKLKSHYNETSLLNIAKKDIKFFLSMLK